MIPLAAALVIWFAGQTSAAPAPGAPVIGSPDRYAQALAKIRQAYLTHKQGQPTLESAVELPAPIDPEQARSDAAIRSAIEAAKEIQLGCNLPCTDPADIQLYRGKVEVVAGKLGLKGPDIAAARENYLPKERPRLRDPRAPKASGEANQEVERIALAKLLANNQTSLEIRRKLEPKALAMAEALGRMKTVNLGADGVAVFAGGQRRVLTAQQIAELNAIPQAQAAILRRLVTNPPPAPLTRDQKQLRVLNDAEQSIKDNPGRVRQAQNFWVAESQNKNSNPLWRGYAYFNRGLLAVSGLGEVEDSAARVGYVSVSDDVSMGRKAWEITKLAGNSAMFAANFVGIGGASKVVRGVQVFEKPIVVDGIKAAGKETAQLVAEHSTQISEALKPALAGGGRDFKAATTALNEYAAKEFPGVLTVERGGKIGQANWISEKSKIVYNPLVGEAHEFAHAHQMFVTRASALEIVAKGRPVASLAPEEINQALELAQRFEEAHYAQYEAQALRSSGFLGLTPGGNYAGKLAANSREITQAMLANPEWKFSTGQKVFGALSGLGDSQVKIGMSLLPVFNIPMAREGMNTIGVMVADALTPDAAAAVPAARSGKP